MKPSRSLAPALSLALATALGQPAPATAGSVEISPFAGYRLGGDFEVRGFAAEADFDTGVAVDESSSYGVVVDVGLSRHVQLELLLSRQETELAAGGGFLESASPLLDLDVDYLHAGVLFQWAGGQARPFLDLTAGLTRLAPETRGFADESRFSVGLGGGVKVLLNEHFGLRFEGRYLSTLIDEDERLFCDEFGFCFEESLSEFLEQGEAAAGLIFAF